MASTLEDSEYTPPLIGTITVPSKVLRKSSGISCDIGGSLAKFVYFSNEDQKTGDDGKTTLNLVSFPKDRIDDGLSYINKCFTTRVTMGDWRDEKITTTGIGAYQYKKKLSEALKVETENIENMVETDCFIKTLQLLGRTVPRAELMNDVDEEAQEQMKKLVEMMFKMMEDLKASGQLKEGMEFPIDEQLVSDTQKGTGASADDLAVHYPCAVCMIGSGAAVLKLEEDGTYSMVDMTNLAGKTFLGLGSLLTGAKTFEELISLAENGSSENVDIMTSDLRSEETDSDIYSAFTHSMDVLLYSFGKSTNKDLGDFKKEDIARCLLANMCQILTQTAQSGAAGNGLKHIYFCGSFIGHELVIREMSKAISHRAMLNPQVNLKLDYGFVKHGGYLGAIGALLFAQEDKYSKIQSLSAGDGNKEASQKTHLELNNNERMKPKKYAYDPTTI
ncbi:unnamed protein product [Owenia fusiformis]|uniref:Uncharacterized protein n=1 Tax=Owenia fusiformis TaxID=6347 RepID=A0A8J1XQS8_OWEFU|nr:unnamed protein product [Owenia fusiformis]